MIGFVASPDSASDIWEALMGRDVLFERVAVVRAPQTARDMAQEAARLPMEAFILDLGAFEEDAAALVLVRHLRFFRDGLRIVVVAPGRVPGDVTMAKLTYLGVWDILVPPRQEEDKQELLGLDQDRVGDIDEKTVNWSLTEALRTQLAAPSRFAEAARWQGLTEDGEEQTEERVRIIERDRIVGVPVVAFCGTDVRCGATYAALGCGSFLSQVGFRVAVVELSSSRPSSATLLRLEDDEPVGEGFRIPRPRLDVFPACTPDSIPRMKSGIYDYVVLDAGAWLGKEVQNEVLRADQLFLCTGPARWDQERLVQALKKLKKTGGEKPVRVLAHFCGERYFQDWLDAFTRDWPASVQREVWPPVTFHRMPLRSDPFDASGEWDKWLCPLLPEERPMAAWIWRMLPQRLFLHVRKTDRRIRKFMKRRRVF